VRLASGSTAEGVVRFRGLQSLDELRSKIQECEQRADELGRAIIKEGYEVAVAEIAKEREARAIMAGGLAPHLDAVYR
jgi:ATP-dependent RNA circularization protein (DNA/RNA ligase family)